MHILQCQNTQKKTEKLTQNQTMMMMMLNKKTIPILRISFMIFIIALGGMLLLVKEEDQ
jgi:hypothetical protein